MVLTLAAARDWKATLEEMGFAPNSAGHEYRRNGLVLTYDDAWFTLEVTEPVPDTDPPARTPGQPGLWKLVPNGDGKLRRLFDLPAAVLTVADDGDDFFDDERSTLEACVGWAEKTAAGALPDSWQPPSRQEVESWIPVDALTVQSGPFVRQGTLIHAESRLALRFPILPRVPADLSPARMSWLREVLLEAQERRLVRIGITETAEGKRVDAEVDLSGAPHAALEVLVGASLNALRWVVEWLVWSAGFLADSQMRCQALEVCPARATPAKEVVG